jgi:drug/metabolite transporter (DMT)-like permease
MKKGLEAFSPQQVAALRIGFACIVLMPLLFFIPKPNWKKHWPGILGMGIFGNLIPAFLFTYAETGISSSLAGMLNALTPMFTILISVLAFKTKTTITQIIGVVLGLTGAVFLIVFSNETDFSFQHFFFPLCVIAATLCYAISVNLIRAYLQDLNSISASVFSFFIIGIPSLIYLFTGDFVQVFKSHSHAFSSLIYIGILGIVGSAISVIAFNRLIKISGAVFASSCTYLIPIVALFWGLLDGEVVQILQILSVFLILGAIYLINKPINKAPDS